MSYLAKGYDPSMCPSLCAQIGLHERQMLKAAGITPIPSSMGSGWRSLDPVCTSTDLVMREEILRQLRKPGTFALLEGAYASGYLWWDEGWVWERWHWNRWPVEVVKKPLRQIAEIAGAGTGALTDSF